MIRKDWGSVTKSDGTKVCGYRSDKGMFLQKIATGERFAAVVCDESEIVNYIETDAKIDFVAILREKLNAAIKNKQ